ncbi:MAG: DUF1330 domain-containing protein [Candidatus Omnitrophota bacterium]|nr:DUF1330 domain-containing protein [Candidatus Omnitrophota bacterium]
MVEIKIKNKETYAIYIEKVRSIVENYNGRYLVRGDKITPLFNSWNPERIIAIEFPSLKDVERWLSSPEYKAIANLSEQSTIIKAIMVESCSNDK